jgi:hypothetical protein
MAMAGSHSHQVSYMNTVLAGQLLDAIRWISSTILDGLIC